MDTLSQLTKYTGAILLMVPMLTIALAAGVVNGNAGWRTVKLWNGMVAKIFRIRVELQFETDQIDLSSGGVMISLNQQSLLDPLLGYSAINRRWLSIWNIEYALIPFFGWTSWILGWVIVRQWPKQAQAQLRKAANHARNGGLVHLSIEGQRSFDGGLSPYKKGPAVLAIESQADIYPFYIHGSRACLLPGEWKIRPGRVIYRFLAPISTKGLSYADRNDLTARLRALGEAEHLRWT